LYIQRSRVEPVGARDSSVDIVTRLRARLLEEIILSENTREFCSLYSFHAGC